MNKADSGATVAYRSRRPPCKSVNLRTLPDVPSHVHGSSGPLPAAAARIAHGFSDPNAVQQANEILLHLNEDLWCNQGTTCDLDEASKTCKDPEPHKLSESDAKRQIQLIFRTPTCWRSDTDQSHLLYLLKQFPVLASQFFDWDYNLFWEHGNEWSTPLSFLIASGASLESIQTAYELYPDTISQPQGVHRDLPLHFACRYSASHEVISFLCHEFPTAVSVPNSSGMLPLHCAMGKKHAFPYGQFHHASLSTVQLLLEMYPEALLNEEKEKFYTPLQIAFNHGYSFEVIDFMMSTIPSTGIKEFKLVGGCYHKLFNVHLDLAESELVSKLLPRLERFKCEPTDWTVDGLVQLLRYLQCNSSVVEFDALNIPVHMLMHYCVVDALKEFLEYNNTVKVLRLSVKKGDNNGNENVDSSIFLRAIDQSLQSNLTVQVLELNNFSVRASHLAAFLADGHAPKTLRLNKFVIVGGEELTIDDFSGARSRVENLVISDCRVKVAKAVEESTQQEVFLRVLNGVSRMPQLKDFTLQSLHLKGIDVSAPLVKLLRTSNSIESLTINGPEVNMEAFCQHLHHNATLRRFNAPNTLNSEANRKFLVEALENHNATLEYVRMSATKEMEREENFQKIQYFTRLNQYGRAKVQDPNTTKAAFVDLLETFRSLSRVCSSPARLAVQYGLLREFPSLWCTSLADQEKDKQNKKKRKREEEYSILV